MSFSSSMIRTFLAMVSPPAVSSIVRDSTLPRAALASGRVDSSQNLANRLAQIRIVERSDDAVDQVRVLEQLELGRGTFDELRVGAPEGRTQVFDRQSTGLTALSGNRPERPQRLLAALEAPDRPNSAQSAAIDFDESLNRFFALALGSSLSASATSAR